MKKQKFCSEEGCGVEHRCKGLCQRHYDQKRRDDKTRKANWQLSEQHYRDMHASPFFEAICPHFVGHHKGSHGCDGCCKNCPKHIWDKVTED